MVGMERTQFAALVLPDQLTAETKLTDDAAHMSAIAGKTPHQWVVDAALGASVRRVAVVSHGLSQATSEAFDRRRDDSVIHVVPPASDTSDTVSHALDHIGSEFTLREAAHVVLMTTACPQVTSADIRRVLDYHLATQAAATLCTGEIDLGSTEPVVSRDEFGRVSSIADVPRGGGAIYCFRADLLVPALRRSDGGSGFQDIGTEVAAVLHQAGHHVETMDYPGRLEMVRSGSSRVGVEALLRRRVIESWIDRGVNMPDPNQVTIDATAHLGKGVTVLPGTVIEGRTVVADGARIGPNTHLIDATIGSEAEIPHCVVQGVEIPPRETLTPFTILPIPGG